MKAIVTGLMLMCVSLPISAEEPPQQRSLDALLNDLQVRRSASVAQTREEPAETITRLKSELVDTRVERDILKRENDSLRLHIEDMEGERASARVCPPGECITLLEAEEEQMRQQALYSFSMYRLAEYMHSVIPETDVEAHRQAEKLLDSAKANLELLGFDTTDPDTFPTLEELLGHVKMEFVARSEEMPSAN